MYMSVFSLWGNVSRAQLENNIYLCFPGLPLLLGSCVSDQLIVPQKLYGADTRRPVIGPDMYATHFDSKATRI